MVLLFLRDWRSAAIVVVTIPVRAAGGGRRAVGRGPDDQHHDARRPGARRRHPGRRGDGRHREHPHAPGARRARSRAACSTPAARWCVPRLLAMLSVVAVFVPSFFMTGVTQSLFVPLSLAVGFAMIASFFLSSSLVPVLAVWLLGRAHGRGVAAHAADWVDRLRDRLDARSCGASRRRAGWLVAAYALVTRRDRRASWACRSAARSFRARRRAPVPAALPGAGRHEVRSDRAARRRDSRRDQPGGRARQRGHHARLRRHPALVVSRSTPSSSGPAARRKACCRWRCRPGAPLRLDALEETLRARFHDAVPRARSSRSSRATSSAAS